MLSQAEPSLFEVLSFFRISMASQGKKLINDPDGLHRISSSASWHLASLWFLVPLFCSRFDVNERDVILHDVVVKISGVKLSFSSWRVISCLYWHLRGSMTWICLLSRMDEKREKGNRKEMYLLHLFDAIADVVTESSRVLGKLILICSTWMVFSSWFQLSW